MIIVKRKSTKSFTRKILVDSKIFLLVAKILFLVAVCFFSIFCTNLFILKLLTCLNGYSSSQSYFNRRRDGFLPTRRTRRSRQLTRQLFLCAAVAMRKSKNEKSQKDLGPNNYGTTTLLKITKNITTSTVGIRDF